MRFLLNLGEVSALQSLRVKKYWHLRQGCMKIHRLAWVDACFSSPPALPSKMHVFFSLPACLQLFYHWQAGMALKRYQIEPQCIKRRAWVKRQGHAFLINANAKANTCILSVHMHGSVAVICRKRGVDVRNVLRAFGRQPTLFKNIPSVLKCRSKCLKLSSNREIIVSWSLA